MRHNGWVQVARSVARNPPRTKLLASGATAARVQRFVRSKANHQVLPSRFNPYFDRAISIKCSIVAALLYYRTIRVPRNMSMPQVNLKRPDFFGVNLITTGVLKGNGRLMPYSGITISVPHVP